MILKEEMRRFYSEEYRQGLFAFRKPELV